MSKLNNNKTAILACWDRICSAVGADIPLTATYELAHHDYTRLHLKNSDPYFPDLTICLRPEMVCINGQMTLFLTGYEDLVVLVSCDLETKVLSVHVFGYSDVASGFMNPTVLRSRFPVAMSLYQIYDVIQRAVKKAFYLNGGAWTPLVLK